MMRGSVSEEQRNEMRKIREKDDEIRTMVVDYKGKLCLV